MSNILTERDNEIFANWLYEHDGDDAGIKKNLEVWEEAKGEYLIKLFGGELIKSKNVTYSMPLAEQYNAFDLINKRYANMFHEIDSIFEQNDYDFCVKHWNWRGTDNHYYVKTYNQTRALFASEYLVENEIKYSFSICHKKDYSALIGGWKLDSVISIIPEGIKPMRCLHKIILPLLKNIATAEEYDYIAEQVEEYGIALSQQYQVTTTTGELCISIHPMDYVTLSDNNCNWTSCMSWENNGGYRAGTLEMLTSPCMIVAYLKSKNPYKEWNSKRWRELFVVKEDILLGIKGYPYGSDSLEDLVLNWVRELAKENLGWTYVNETPIRQRSTENFEFNNTTYYWDIEFNKMYNDCYLNHPIYLGESLINMVNNIYIVASGPAIDIKDGTNLEDDDEISENFLTHPHNLGYEQCVQCGYWVNKHDLGSDGYCSECQCELDED